MKRLSLVFALFLGSVSITFAQQRTPPMRLTTQAFADGTVIPLKYTQASPDGAVSPGLNWSNVPAGTQSFVLWMHDVDLALNKTSEDNLHWLVWNIPGQDTSLAEKIPTGSQLTDGSYQLSYAGPNYRGPGAPAAGPLHHYIFELYALDIKLDEKPGSTAFDTKTNVFKLMQGHILGKAAYVGLFKRPK
jgi:Raf kinase inhibitor-like YbhB/YbcL family protein